ncbi:MAG: hypothetical protein LBJ95_04540 [Oscillospiraceae bacterium]|nr:hypothetical protein [Oscillospiraceae bacterium]
MKIKYSWIPFVVAFLTLIPLNVCRLFTENKESQNLILGLSLDVWYLTLLLVFSLIIIFFVVFSKDSNQSVFSTSTVSDQMLTFIPSIAIFCHTFRNVLMVIYFPLPKETADKILFFVEIIFGLLVAVVFGAISVGCTVKNEFLKKFSLIYILPTVWSGIRLFELFADYKGKAFYNIDMLDLLALGMFTLFFFYQATVFAEIKSKNNKKKLFIFGMLSIIFAFTYYIGNFVEKIMNNEFEALLLFPGFVDLILGIYVLTYLFKGTINRSELEEVYEAEER